MKILVHLLLALTLLLQGASAVAMPMYLEAPAPHQAMAHCHETAGKAKPAMPCCKKMSAASCHAACAAPALLPIRHPLAAAPTEVALAIDAPRDDVLAAHGATPLRPPISGSW